MSKLGSALQGYSNTAPAAGYGPNVNFGRLVATPMVKRFKGKGEMPDVFDLKDGYDLQAKEFMIVKFSITLSEFNPNLEFDYERSVDIRKSSETTKSDWAEIVEPSLIKAFGNNWGDVILSKPYVEVEDVPNVAGTVSKSGKLLMVPRFVKMFKTKAECAAAREARFGSGATGGGSDATEESPAEVIASVKGLVKSVGSVDKARNMIEENHPFGEYDTEALLAAAGAK